MLNCGNSLIAARVLWATLATLELRENNFESVLLRDNSLIVSNDCCAVEAVP